MEIVQRLEKLNSISRARLNFRRRPFCVQLCIETFCQRATSVAHLTNFSFDFFLWYSHRRCLFTSAIQWCKKVKNDQKLKSRGPALNQPIRLSFLCTIPSHTLPPLPPNPCQALFVVAPDTLTHIHRHRHTRARACAQACTHTRVVHAPGSSTILRKKDETASTLGLRANFSKLSPHFLPFLLKLFLAVARSIPQHLSNSPHLSFIWQSITQR